MNELLRLLDQRVGYFRARVAQCAYSDAAAKIEIAAAVDIKNKTSLPALQREVEPRVRRNDILVECFLN